jgi:hypothetical protein
MPIELMQTSNIYTIFVYSRNFLVFPINEILLIINSIYYIKSKVNVD